LWGDDFIVAKPSRTQQLLDAYYKYNTTILGSIVTKNPNDAKRYGFAKGKEVENGVIKIEELIEKPGVDKKPSDLAVVSGQVFTPEIFSALREFQPEDGKELVMLMGSMYCGNAVEKHMP
jgi:UTP--glucose-1-phosphate uridylyltransferase